MCKLNECAEESVRQRERESQIELVNYFKLACIFETIFLFVN